MRNEVPLLASAIAGLGALLLVGVPLAVVATAIALVGVAPFARSWVARVPFGVLTAVALAATAVAASWGHGVLGLAVLLAWLQVHRLMTRHGPGDDRVAVLLSAVMLVLAASRNLDVALAVPLLAWAAAAPVALLDTTSSESSGRGVALAVAGVGIAVFLALPRPFAGPTVAAGPALTGFSSEVALGDLDVLWEDPTPVVRVRVEGPAPAEPLRLRGAVLDTFDGRAWTARSERTRFEGGGEGDLLLVVTEESVVENVLLSLGEPVDAEIGGLTALRDEDGTLWVDHPGAPLAYVVVSRSVPAEAPLSEADRKRLTDLPDDLDGRIGDLADTLAPEGTGAGALAEAVRARLVSEYAYTRIARDAGEEEPLSWFLFDRKRGHCEYFASAAAVLLRSRHVPARLVTGFAGGERTAEGWRFRRAHAHAWVEYHDGTGWRVLDATPGPRPPRPPAFALRMRDALGAAWADQVVGYDRGVQIAVLWGVGQGVERAVGLSGPPWAGLAIAGFAGVVVLVGAAVALRRLLARLAGERERVPSGRVAAAYSRAWRGLRRKGWAPPPALPPVAAARFVRERAGDAAAPLERLAWLHYAVRYGGADDATLAAEAATCADQSASIPAP